MTWQGQEVQFRYADTSSYQYGYKYYTYIFQIKNASGKVIFTKTMSSRFRNHEEEILKFAERDKFNEDGKSIRASRSKTIF